MHISLPAPHLQISMESFPYILDLPVCIKESVELLQNKPFEIVNDFLEEYFFVKI